MSAPEGRITRAQDTRIVNAMSVDVEDWYQVGAFERTIDRAGWDLCESRVERNTDACLALFERAGVKATFFTLGYVAARHPSLMRRIVAAGHELASHGWDHARVFTMTPDEFRADLRRTRDTLEDAGGVAVTGYRAPSFSIDARTPWAHPILAEEGYAYSSSVAPVRHDHYGWPDSPRFAWSPVKGSPLVELPVTTARAAGRTLAAGGGGFFRLLPFAFSRWAVGQVNRAGQPAIFYFHPWEIDPEQPRVEQAPLRSRLRHYSRLSAMEGKLEKMLRAVAWDRTDRVVARRAAA
ncbi:XrtA system polysaccharide deacetylase [Sphingomonas jatrophae]|uniref:Chitooligosaccharide deacetylase n=1 Tax=Sphingomonas jatrophae TaxID=1166337 RepID=A0A1I6JWU6_9SPHN|nr:XrtA system polysaccharide deacetylase [Sphingomonas jatrophae]SFR83401.1 polysaccharide deacetylase family protein, PEP-CTERM locus subfamily [Sphingomonas jatrophae]